MIKNKDFTLFPKDEFGPIRTLTKISLLCRWLHRFVNRVPLDLDQLGAQNGQDAVGQEEIKTTVDFGIDTFNGLHGQEGDEHPDHKNIRHRPFADEEDKAVDALTLGKAGEKNGREDRQTFQHWNDHREKQDEETDKAIAISEQFLHRPHDGPGLIVQLHIPEQRNRLGNLQGQKIEDEARDQKAQGNHQ